MKCNNRKRTKTWVRRLNGELELHKGNDSWKYNKDGYINIDGYMSFMNPNWRSVSTFCMMNGPRNMGKSYGMWSLIQDDWNKFNGNVKAGYCRTNMEKAKHAKENFNAKFRGEYFMNYSKIYKQNFDDNGKEILKDRVEYGSVFSLNQAENYKSGFFENYQWFFWDEYNESVTDRNQFINFLDLTKTIKRKTEPLHIFLIGNKVNATNDMIHNLQIDLDDIPNSNDDYIIEFDENSYFIEIGNDTFKEHNPSTDLIHRLARYNDQTNAYLNDGTYLSIRTDGMILYNKYVKPSHEVFCYFTSDDYIFEFGDFYHKNNIDKNGNVIDENDTELYFHMIQNIPEDNELPIYALNVMGDIRESDSQQMKDSQLHKFFKMIRHNAKHGKLWFCEMDTKSEIEYYICKLFL